MLTSLDQLFKHYSVSENSAQKMRIVCKPRASNYTSLVYNFEDTRLPNFHLCDYEMGHRLVPFGGDTYGVYAMEGYNSFNNNAGSLNVEYEGDSHTFGTPRIIIKFNKAAYNAATEECNKFWEWRNNRNPTRLAMEEEFSFDGKYASHCVRLLRMGQRLLKQDKSMCIVQTPKSCCLFVTVAGRTKRSLSTQKLWINTFVKLCTSQQNFQRSQTLS